MEEKTQIHALNYHFESFVAANALSFRKQSDESFPPLIIEVSILFPLLGSASTHIWKGRRESPRARSYPLQN